MKKVFILLFAILPAWAFAADYSISVNPDHPTKSSVTVKGYNDRIPTADLQLEATYSQDNKTLDIVLNSEPKPAGKGKADKGKAPAPEFIWFPQNEVKFDEFKDYFKKRGGALKTSNTFNEQVSAFNLYDTSIKVAAEGKGCSFEGIELTSSQKPSKASIDRQILPLDGSSKMSLSFKLDDGARKVNITLKNPMAMGKGKILDYMGADIEIEVNLESNFCRDNQQLLAIAQEYLAIFTAGEEKLEELQKSGRALMSKCKELLVEQYARIDIRRFDNSGCEELQFTHDDIVSCMERIKEVETAAVASNENASCDAQALNASIRAATSKLNAAANDWISAKEASVKEAKKASFDSIISETDATISNLSAACKAKLDSKILKNYETAKKLIK